MIAIPDCRMVHQGTLLFIKVGKQWRVCSDKKLERLAERLITIKTAADLYAAIKPFTVPLFMVPFDD